ncbi:MULTISPECIES: hypothetical protein [Ruminococcus]|uniref:DUF4380 domain-containing protein n=1 Tax=Ruminococcus albus 8 TaxID=246199 RepID=E9SDV7_RUMAL|nr:MULTISPECIES: hypothetical protein [Ruminococcus]MBE6874032.1 hypothetical protein [Ruminococcus albus]EGC02697.1 hypothetical protein CUS_7123 [Ruminococcus albus 8]MBQ9541340.1 hypothetical protein [Ruminococcus sp.]MBR0528477.1 hypothetical protein [Ruminococcus sp.]MCC3350170.1 hypothetical protein [Ruminococcus albus 8]
MSVKVTEKEYEGYGKCVFIENDACTLAVTIEFGPRVIYFARKGRKNVMLEDRDGLFTVDVEGYGTWRNRGGHRLWVAPELLPETYYPDNAPVAYKAEGDTVTFTPPVTPFAKQLETVIKLDADKAVAEVTQRITNVGDKEADFALWSITGLTDGGTAVIPMCTRKAGYLPNRVMSLWDYSDINDPRFKLTNEYARIRQDKFLPSPFKAGFNVEDGFAAYAVNEQIFVKCFGDYQFVEYPDYSCNFEMYTNYKFLECEILGEKRKYQPGESTEVTETWHLLDNEGDKEPELDKIRTAVGK